MPPAKPGAYFCEPLKGAIEERPKGRTGSRCFRPVSQSPIVCPSSAVCECSLRSRRAVPCGCEQVAWYPYRPVVDSKAFPASTIGCYCCARSDLWESTWQCQGLTYVLVKSSDEFFLGKSKERMAINSDVSKPNEVVTNSNPDKNESRGFDDPCSCRTGIISGRAGRGFSVR